MAIGHTRAPRAGGHRDCCVVCYNTPRHTTPIARLFRTAYRVASRFQIETPRVSVYRSVAGQRSSILRASDSASVPQAPPILYVYALTLEEPRQWLQLLVSREIELLRLAVNRDLAGI